MKKKRILVTGGLGLLGKSIISKLVSEKHKVFVLDKKKILEELNHLKSIKLNLSMETLKIKI